MMSRFVLDKKFRIDVFSRNLTLSKIWKNGTMVSSPELHHGDKLIQIESFAWCSI